MRGPSNSVGVREGEGPDVRGIRICQVADIVVCILYRGWPQRGSRGPISAAVIDVCRSTLWNFESIFFVCRFTWLLFTAPRSWSSTMMTIIYYCSRDTRANPKPGIGGWNAHKSRHTNVSAAVHATPVRQNVQMANRSSLCADFGFCEFRRLLYPQLRTFYRTRTETGLMYELVLNVFHYTYILLYRFWSAHRCTQFISQKIKYQFRRIHSYVPILYVYMYN